MKKRILSLLLSICVIASIMQVNAFASTHDHCVCGGDVNAGDHKNHTNITYNAISGNFEGG